MSRPQVIDIHTHVFTEPMMASLRRQAPSLNLKLTPIDRDGAVLEIADIVQKPFPRKAWDMDERFQDMEAQGVDVQLISNVPHTFLYEENGSLTAATSAILNDAISDLMKEYPGRLRGLATLPMQAPELAAKELRRAMCELGLSGAHIGSNIQGRNLDDPALEPVWQAADELGAFMMVHPHQIAARDRLKSYYLQNLIGNPLETTIAAASLVFGGVVERHAGIRFCLVHGGGFTPFQAGRFVHGWNVRREAKEHLSGSPQASLDRLLYDTILHARQPLEFLIQSVGASRVLLGSDYPFDMGQYDAVALIRSLPILDADKDTILGGAASILLREPAAAEGNTTPSA